MQKFYCLRNLIISICCTFQRLSTLSLDVSFFFLVHDTTGHCFGGRLKLTAPRRIGVQHFAARPQNCLGSCPNCDTMSLLIVDNVRSKWLMESLQEIKRRLACNESAHIMKTRNTPQRVKKYKGCTLLAGTVNAVHDGTFGGAATIFQRLFWILNHGVAVFSMAWHNVSYASTFYLEVVRSIPIRLRIESWY